MFSDTFHDQLEKFTVPTQIPVIYPGSTAPYRLTVPTEYELKDVLISKSVVYTQDDIVELKVVSAEWDGCYDLIGGMGLGEIKNNTDDTVEILGISFWFLDSLVLEVGSGPSADPLLQSGQKTNFSTNFLFGGCIFGEGYPVDLLDYDYSVQARIRP